MNLVYEVLKLNNEDLQKACELALSFQKIFINVKHVIALRAIEISMLAHIRFLEKKYPICDTNIIIDELINNLLSIKTEDSLA